MSAERQAVTAIMRYGCETWIRAVRGRAALAEPGSSEPWRCLSGGHLGSREAWLDKPQYRRTPILGAAGTPPHTWRRETSSNSTAI
ncbi:hypothetical protein E2C01_013076 [Portunus trituberculatus]|uniref:Uncharacterized protein n=1 Tax=Portunus trituberculatus TaxID=210409 RepID=A0A5B7DGD8_PORTR|nr:hypothetical protein [Portunus trituberculatus]